MEKGGTGKKQKADIRAAKNIMNLCIDKHGMLSTLHVEWDMEEGGTGKKQKACGGDQERIGKRRETRHGESKNRSLDFKTNGSA